MVRNAMFQRVQLAARDRFADLGRLDSAAAALSDPPARAEMTGAAWEPALGDYWDEHETIDDGPAARAPELLLIEPSAAGAARTWTVRQIINEPEGDHDWAIVATIDLEPPTPRASR